MSTVSELVTWAAKETELKLVTGIPSTVSDTLIQYWLGAATAKADEYLEQDYDDLASVPKGVIHGVYEYVKVLWLVQGQRPGVTTVKTGDLQESYAGEFVANPAFAAAKPHWVLEKASAELDGK